MFGAGFHQGQLFDQVWQSRVMVASLTNDLAIQNLFQSHKSCHMDVTEDSKSLASEAGLFCQGAGGQLICWALFGSAVG